MLRIAVPNKGSLSGPAAEMLHEAGYQQRKESKELRDRRPGERGRVLLPAPPRHRDLRRPPASSTSASPAATCCSTPAPTPRRSSRSASPAPPSASPPSPAPRTAVEDLDGKTVATSYEGIVAKHLADHGIDASVVHLDGAVETAIELGVAEVIADVVETGTTLRNAGLEVFGEPIMKSEAVVIRRTGADAEDDPRSSSSCAASRASWSPGRYVMMDYDCRVEQLEKAVALTPGLESPTVSPLHNEGWVAVRSMVRTTRRCSSVTTDCPTPGNSASLMHVTIRATFTPGPPCGRSFQARGTNRAGSWVRATSERRSARSGPTTPAARACTSTLPMAVASTGPASTGRPDRSAIAWQSSEF